MTVAVAVTVLVAVAVTVTITATDALMLDIPIRSYFAFRAILHCGQVAGVAGNSSLGSCSAVPGAAVHLVVRAFTHML